MATKRIAWNTGTGIDHYTYTYTVSGDSAIVVTIGSIPAGNKIFVKHNGSWVEATDVLVKVNGTWQSVSSAYKKVNGSWVEQDDKSAMFDSDAIYIGG